MTKRIVLEINVDEDVDKKYPNYKHNFKKIEEFIQFLLEDVIVDNSLFGYTIKLIEDNDKPKKAKPVLATLK